MDADSFTSEILPSKIIRMGIKRDVFGINDILHRGVVGNGEINLFGALFGNSDTSSTYIANFAFFDIINDGGELDVGESDGLVEFLTNAIHDVYIDTDDLIAFIEFKRGKEGIGVDDNICRTAKFHKQEDRQNDEEDRNGDFGDS